MKTEIYATDDFRSPHMVAHPSHMPDRVGEFALALIERWGLVAATDGGEDSAGRAKLTLLPVGALVERACDTAEQTFEALAERGHLIELPSWERMREMAREERDRN